MRGIFQKKIKYILLVLFLVSIIVVSVWYFFFYRCVQLPGGFEFLEGFETVNQCDHKEYSVKGIIYNIRENNDDITFDFNLWDIEERESLYYEDISVPLDIFPEDFDTSLGSFGAVDLTLGFDRDDLGILSLLLPAEFTTKSMDLDEIVLTEKEYEDAFDSLYTAITVSPLIGDIEGNNFPTETLNAVITDVYKENAEYYPSLSDDNTNRQLYRPWVLSYLYKYQDEYDIDIEEQDIIDMLDFDLDQWYYALEKEGELQYTNSECEKETEIEGDFLELDTSGYQYSNSFACLMIWQISENIDIDESVISRYCDYDYFVDSYQSDIARLEDEIKYSISDFVNYVNLEGLSNVTVSSSEEEYGDYLSYNISSLPADFYAFQKLYGVNMDLESESLLNYALSYNLWSYSMNLQNIGSIFYYTNLSYSQNTDVQVLSNKISELFSEVSTEILSLLDNDQYSAVLSLEGLSYCPIDENEELITANIIKTVYLYLQESPDFTGIWVGEDYDIRSSARFLVLLVKYRDLLL